MQPERKSGHEYDCVYYPPAKDPSPWHYNPMFPPASPVSQFYPGFYPIPPPQPVADPWSRASHSPVAYKSSSTDRLHMITPVRATGCPAIYSLRSPNPSPVHTPSSSPILSRSRASPSPGTSPAAAGNRGSAAAANGRRPAATPSPVLQAKGAASKPPRPRQRPVLQRARTVDYPLDCLSDANHCLTDDGFRVEPYRESSTPQRLMDATSKIPSLDSLYEHLKAFASSSTNALPNQTPANYQSQYQSPADETRRDRSATFSGKIIASRNGNKVFDDRPCTTFRDVVKACSGSSVV